MLERRDDSLALDAVDGLGAEDAADQGIFGVVFEVAAVAHVALQIDPAGQLDVEAPGPRLAANRRAAFAREPGLKLEPTTIDAGKAVAPLSSGR
jgi:hypothetical protein